MIITTDPAEILRRNRIAYRANGDWTHCVDCCQPFHGNDMCTEKYIINPRQKCVSPTCPMHVEAASPTPTKLPDEYASLGEILVRIENSTAAHPVALAVCTGSVVHRALQLARSVMALADSRKNREL